MQSYYEELGIDSSATADEINAAFRRLAKMYHPDLNVGHEEASRAAFLSIQKAFEFLSDPVRRARYDAAMDAASNHWGLPPSSNAVEIQPIHEFQIHPTSLEPAVTLPPAPRRLDPELRKVFIFVGICILLAMAIILIVV
jgi:DnaJ-domain-containing protein 1